MFKEVRQKLNECHLTAGGEFLGVLLRADPRYLIQRALEEIEPTLSTDKAVLTADTDNRLKLAIQLLNLARTKLCNPGVQSGSKKARKRTGKTSSSGSSNPATGS